MGAAERFASSGVAEAEPVVEGSGAPVGGVDAEPDPRRASLGRPGEDGLDNAGAKTAGRGLLRSI